MRPEHIEQPDLVPCVLEERCVLAVGAGAGLGVSPFLAETLFNSIVVPSLDMSAFIASPTTAPGPHFVTYDTGMPQPVSQMVVAIGSAAHAGRVPAGRQVKGYGASFSTGYGLGLNSLNNFGMNANALGSVPAHTFDKGTVEQTPEGTWREAPMRRVEPEITPRRESESTPTLTPTPAPVPAATPAPAPTPAAGTPNPG